MICDKCHKEVYFLFGRIIDGEHCLLCWDCIVGLKNEKNEIEEMEREIEGLNKEIRYLTLDLRDCMDREMGR